MPLSASLRRALLLAGLATWCGSLLVARQWVSGVTGYRFLVWNLFLALLPPLFSWMLVRNERDRGPGVVSLAWATAWLLFLPNAPYLITDFVHLWHRPPVPLWFDIALLGSFSAAGLLLAYQSVLDVHAVVARRAGAIAGWASACAALLLAGFGIYLGRFLRWNSWDVVTHPHARLASIAHSSLDPSDHPRTVGVTLVFGVGLLLGYMALWLLVPERAKRRRMSPGAAMVRKAAKHAASTE